MGSHIKPILILTSLPSPVRVIPLAHSAAQRMRAAMSEKAEAEKILQVKKAEGDAEAKYLAGVGVARQRQAIVDGLWESVMGFSEKVSDEPCMVLLREGGGRSIPGRRTKRLTPLPCMLQ